MLFIFKKLELLMISRSFGYKMQCLCKRRKKLISSSNRMHAGIACRVFSCSTYEGSRTRINMGVAFLRTSHLLAYIESIHDKTLFTLLLLVFHTCILFTNQTGHFCGQLLQKYQLHNFLIVVQANLSSFMQKINLLLNCVKA